MTPTPDQIAEAMRIVSTPDRHARYRRQDAWLLLKEARGQRIKARNLPGFLTPAAPDPEPGPQAAPGPMSEPCYRRMLAHAHANGIGLHRQPQGGA